MPTSSPVKIPKRGVPAPCQPTLVLADALGSSAPYAARTAQSATPASFCCVR